MKKPTLYIIHGWTYTVTPWEKTLTLLKDEYNITTKMLHVPGLTEPSRKVWTVEEYAKWANKNIPDGAIALGHSNGGRILLNLLSKKPEKLSHLILLDAAGVYTESKKRNRSAKASKLFAPLKRFKLLRKVYHKLLGATDYDRAPENMKKTLTNMINSDRDLNLEAVTTPTTILWGKLDIVTPPSDAEKLHEKLPNSTLKFYANWRHAPYIDDPAGLARALNTALENIIAEKSKPAPRIAPKPKAPKARRVL